MRSEIKRWGNSAAIRIPSKILAQANLDVSSPISIDVKAGKIVIAAAVESQQKVNLPFSESDLLSGLDAHCAHANELAQLAITELEV
jgi:Growth regulator